MAKQIAKILKTDMMADINMPALAQLLQKMGRGKDKVLAHITKEEAALLKKRGGAGTRNPETGLLEFFEGEGGYVPDFGYGEGAISTSQTVSPETGQVFQNPPSEVTLSPATRTADYSGFVGLSPTPMPQ